MLIFLAGFMGAVVWVGVHKPRLLVLHSYDDDYVWTRGVNEGLSRILDGRIDVTVRYHEMSTKKRSDKDFLHRAAVSAHQAITDFRPDVIIAVDDYAQKLVASDYVNNPDVKIVFAGVNGGVEPYGYIGADNVTGIMERKPAWAVHDVLNLLTKELGMDPASTPRVKMLVDGSLSNKRDAEHMAKFKWAPYAFLGYQAVENFADWKSAVLTIDEQTDFLLVSGYRKLHAHAGSLAEDDFVPAQEVMAWTEANSPIPVIGTNIFNSEEGAMLSVGVSPYEQGEESAKMALSILFEGKSPKDMPHMMPTKYLVGARQTALEERQVKLPRMITAFASGTNNFFE